MAVQSFAMNLGLTAALREGAGLPPAVAFGLTLIVVTTINFLLLRHVVFPSRHRPWFAQLAEFVGSIAAFRLAEYAAFVLIYEALGVHYLLTITAILTASFVGKFLVYRLRIFPEAGPRSDAS